MNCLFMGKGSAANISGFAAALTCWDSAVVERFFGSLKHDWIFKIAQPTREHMKKDVAAYMRYVLVKSYRTLFSENFHS